MKPCLAAGEHQLGAPDTPFLEDDSSSANVQAAGEPGLTATPLPRHESLHALQLVGLGREGISHSAYYLGEAHHALGLSPATSGPYQSQPPGRLGYRFASLDIELDANRLNSNDRHLCDTTARTCSWTLRWSPGLLNYI